LAAPVQKAKPPPRLTMGEALDRYFDTVTRPRNREVDPFRWTVSWL